MPATPVSLPPPIPPQQLTREAIASGARQQVSVRFMHYRMHIAFDERVISDDTLGRAISGNDSLRDALASIARAYYDAGYPAARVCYAQDGDDVYVQVRRGQLDGVRGEPPVLVYFDDLPVGQALRSTDLEPRRALAGVAAARAGISLSPKFVPVDSDGAILDLGTPQGGPRQTYVQADFSNFGSRYSSRYMLDALLRQSFASGDELRIAATTGLRGFAFSDASAGAYHDGSAEWTRVSRYGLLGADARYSEFTQYVTQAQLDGELDNEGISFLRPLYADLSMRWNLKLRIDRTHRRTAVDSSGEEVYAEQYNSVEADSLYVWQPQTTRSQWGLQARLVARQGLGSHTTTLSPANLDYFLLRPSLNLHYVPDGPLSYAFDAEGQLGGAVMPDQEQWVLGGPTNMRAYLPGYAVGDTGGSGRLSAQWRPVSRGTLQLQPKALVEYGYSRYHADVPGRPSGAVRLADAGLQLDLRWRSWLEASLSVARPFYESGTDNAQAGSGKEFYYFQLSGRY